MPTENKRTHAWMLCIKALGAFCLLMIGATMALGSPNAPRLDEPIVPIPLNHNVDPARAALGESLFHETLLSGDNTISCASCHNIDNYGVDGIKTSIGIRGQIGSVNAPTVMNTRFNFSQFWDGRAEDLIEQAKGPVTNPIEMGATWEQVIKRLNEDESYKSKFFKLYPKRGITPDTIADAIKHYEYTLNTIHSPFDQYLRGDDNAITAQQKHGYELFKGYGCVACHQGVNVGGNMYQRMGAFIPYFTKKNINSKDDYGRFNVTGDKDDTHVFKVPSLRLAAHTAPYFHDGSAETLKDAIKVMAKYQIGTHIPDQDIKDIEAFIRSLSGRYIK